MWSLNIFNIFIKCCKKKKKKLVVEKWSVLNNLLVPSYFFIQFCEKEKLKVSEMWHVMCYVKGRWKVMSFGKHIVWTNSLTAPLLYMKWVCGCFVLVASGTCHLCRGVNADLIILNVYTKCSLRSRRRGGDKKREKRGGIPIFFSHFFSLPFSFPDYACCADYSNSGSLRKYF